MDVHGECLILIRVIAICWLSVATWQKQHLTCCRLDLLLGCYNCPIHLSLCYLSGSPSNFLFCLFFHLSPCSSPCFIRLRDPTQLVLVHPEWILCLPSLPSLSNKQDNEIHSSIWSAAAYYAAMSDATSILDHWSHQLQWSRWMERSCEGGLSLRWSWYVYYCPLMTCIYSECSDIYEMCICIYIWIFYSWYV